MHPIIRETLVITFWTFWTSAFIGGATSLLLDWPLTLTYLLAVFTVGPALAVLRGRNREKDKLEVGERAGVELLALILLAFIGWLSGRYLGR